MRTLKAQSAMEYLMTYGWAILIIAVVLGALFSLGVFSGASLLGTTCIASSGYLCSGLVLSHTTGLTFNFGQSTGTNWATANIMFIPSGSSAPNSLSAANGCYKPLPAPFNSGQSQSVTISCNSLPTSVGGTLAGSLWVAYNVTGSSGGLIGPYYVQVATLTEKAS